MFNEEQIDFITMPYLIGGCNRCNKLFDIYDEDVSYELNVIRLLYHLIFSGYKPSDFCARDDHFVYEVWNMI